MLNSKAFKLYIYASAVSRLVWFTLMASVTIAQYKDVSPEMLSWLTLIGAVLSSGANWLMEKKYDYFKSWMGAFLILDVLSTLLSTVGSIYYDPRFYISVSLTLHMFVDVFIMTVWEDYKQRTGEGRAIQNQFGKVTGNGRALGLVFGVVFARYNLVPSYEVVMWWLVVSATVTNILLYRVMK